MMDLVDVVRRAARAMFNHWPSACVLCSAPGVSASLDLCAACHAELPRNRHACDRCAEPLAASEATALVCGRCLQRLPRFATARCAFRYAYPIDHAVRDLKYGGAVVLGRVLGELLAEYLRARPGFVSPEAIVPVPLAHSRFRQRGYNQAIEIASVLEARLGIPLCTELVVRTRNTREQAELDRQQRRRNVRGAFEVVRPLEGAHLALVDDVITTGSTANELARVLLRAGAARVDVWAVARAGRK